MIKTIPDLNKVKFTKLHRKRRIRTVNKGNKGKSLSSYNLGLRAKTSTIINAKQLESLKKALNRNLKTKDKKNKKNFKIIKSVKNTADFSKRKKKKEKVFFLRYNLSLGLTKKPLQVRMGKGKGAPVEWVYPVAKNRILMEFNLKRKLLKRFNKVKRVLKKSSKKLKVKSKIVLSNSENKFSVFERLAFNKFSKKISCIKEL